MAVDDLTGEPRLGAIELLLHEILAFRSPIERLDIVTRAVAAMTAVEAEAVLSGDPARRTRTTEQRIALERMME